MFSFLPILGPIINGIVSIFTKAQDTALGKYQADATVATAEINASAQTITALKDDLGIQLSRDLILFGVAVNVAFVSWDNLVVHTYPDLYWKVSEYPPSLAFLPYAVITFLFGINAINVWKAFR
jgi:hypothetical protein